jgi:Arc/MetJ family transcription regulator
MAAYDADSYNTVSRIDILKAVGRASAADHTIKRTTVDLDMDELQAAREILGTETTRDTINTALRDVRRRAALARAAALIEQGDLDIIQPEELAALRQARV